MKKLFGVLVIAAAFAACNSEESTNSTTEIPAATDAAPATTVVPDTTAATTVTPATTDAAPASASK